MKKLNENEIDFAVVDGLKDQTRGDPALIPGRDGGGLRPLLRPHGSVTVKELAGYRLLLREKGSGTGSALTPCSSPTDAAPGRWWTASAI
ncbi:MAG: hypothetical protein ACLU8D_08055 [Enterocloster sp.]